MFFCSEFPARLQSLNSVRKPEHIQRGRNFRHFEAGRTYKVTAELTAIPRRMTKIACDLTTVKCTKEHSYRVKENSSMPRVVKI